jgi:hypothetical protein
VRRFLIFLVALMFAGWGISVMRDPYRTRLPQSDDIRSVEAQLNRLPLEDRELVIGYLQRSHGDVLPGHFADPDDPLTARTFAEAIALQKHYVERVRQREAAANARAAARAAALAPLRAALDVRLLDRRVMPRSEAMQLLPPQNQMTDETPVLVSTYTIENVARNGNIDALKLGVNIYRLPRKSGDASIDSCFIEHDASIGEAERIEIRCGNLNRRASDADRSYTELGDDELEIEVVPRLIRFADGSELKYDGE